MHKLMLAGGYLSQDGQLAIIEPANPVVGNLPLYEIFDGGDEEGRRETAVAGSDALKKLRRS